MQDNFTFDKGRTSEKKSGRSSFLTVFLIIVGIAAVLGLGTWGLVYFVGGGSSLFSKGGIGIIEIEGVIMDEAPYVEMLSRFRRSDDIKAIILRIDSPGGGVAATQEIYREIKRTKNEKKVIASLGSMAASGGLYVAAAADQIMANPATVTGSVGVIMQMVNVEELMDKIGLNPVIIKSGRFKDIGSSSRPMSPEEKALLQKVVDQLHMQFVRDLAEGRGMEVDKVSELADGRIFTGEQALELGLIDKLGNFEDAITEAKNAAGLHGRPNLVYPRKKEAWWKELLGESSLLNRLPDFSRQPLSFQYLYLPGK